MLGERWAGVPRAVRLVVGTEVLLLGYGAVVHIVQLVVGGFQPYPWAPTWLAVYFTSLTLADPLAAVLLWTRRVAGLYLGAVVFVTDALANGYASYVLPAGTITSRLAQAIISLIAVTALVTAPHVHPWLSQNNRR